jgi:Multiubiquitin
VEPASRGQEDSNMTAVEAAAEKTKTVTIIVNTKPHEWAQKEITFEQVVELAFPGQPYDPQGTTVEYSRGNGPDKSLRPGESVRVKDGMIFDVEPANRS